MLATAAMYSAGDPSKLASVFQMMPEEDYQLYERMQDDVWARAQSMPGITEPLGFFDPLGFCAECSEGRLCFYREVEVKHGRVAMLASLGIIVAEQFHPFFVGWKDLPSSIAWEQVSLKKFWEVLTVSIAIPEMLSVFTFNAPWEKVYSPYGPVNAGLWSVRSSTVNGFDRVPGDLGFDPLDLKPIDPREYHEMLTMELNNGRLAMIAATGMLVQEMVTGRKIF
jgi:light-harvesting complex I chlorophyll a/b binding protein 1